MTVMKSVRHIEVADLGKSDLTVQDLIKLAA